MDFSKFNKVNRSQSDFEIKDEKTGYHAKGKRQKVWGGGFGFSFTMSNEIISESDPSGTFPLLGFSFDDILSLGDQNSNSGKKAITSNKKSKKNDDDDSSFFGRMLTWF